MGVGLGVINSNQSAIFTKRILDQNERINKKALEKLSSGLRINRAADDAAGLAVSEKMRAQVHGLDQASINVQDAISMVQTAEGVLDVSNTIINRMRQLAIQSANDNYTNSDRMEIQEELDQLVDQLDRVANYTEFNTKVLLNGKTIGNANSSDKKVAQVDLVGDVQDADYVVTVLDAGTASNVHGNINISDSNSDGNKTLADLGVEGDQELHIKIDDQTRIVMVNEDDSLSDVVKKINDRNVGVLAGLDGDSNDITLTSVHSGSRFNISFGNDPDGVALKLGLFGGEDLSRTKNTVLTESDGNSYRTFTSGTDTIISISNVTSQTMFPTVPGFPTEAGGYTQSLGIFRSNSDFFTEKELSNPINGLPNGPNHSAAGTPDLSTSQLLKGMVLRIDEQLDYGYNQLTNDDETEGDFTGNWPDDPNGVGFRDYRAQVPEEREVIGTTALEIKSITQVNIRVRSNKQKFHVGANEGEIFATSFGNVTPENLGLAVKLQSDGAINSNKTSYSTGTRNAGPLYQMTISIQTRDSAENAITVIDDALKKISEQRTALGSLQNSLEKTHDYINQNQLHASESRIRDADMAKEMMTFTRTDILSQASMSMLSQANTKSQIVLQLLQ